MTERVVYVVVHDPDPGYAAAHVLGVYTSREAAEQRAASVPDADVDVFVVEAPLDEPIDEVLSR